MLLTRTRQRRVKKQAVIQPCVAFALFHKVYHKVTPYVRPLGRTGVAHFFGENVFPCRHRIRGRTVHECRTTNERMSVRHSSIREIFVDGPLLHLPENTSLPRTTSPKRAKI